MTEEELISATIDNYVDFQRIKKANKDHENQELDYLIKVTVKKLSAFGVSVEGITLA